MATVSTTKKTLVKKAGKKTKRSTNLSRSNRSYRQMIGRIDLWSTFKDFSFISFQVLEGLLLIGFVFVAIMTILTVIAAALYNIFAEAIGGIEIYVVEETKSTKI